MTSINGLVVRLWSRDLPRPEFLSIQASLTSSFLTMFVLWFAILLTADAAGLVDLQDIIDSHLETAGDGVSADIEGRVRCRDITDIETLCEHKKQCMDVMPDLPDLCRSFKREKTGVDEFVEIIDMRRSETHIISMLSDVIQGYADASPPLIIQGPKNLTVTPGSQYQLECKAEGAPTPKLTITRLEEASLNRVKSKKNKLDVQMSAAHVIHKNERVQIQDEGWYRCVAANNRGVVFADAYLRVYDLCGDITCTGGKICVPDNEAATASCVCPECVDPSYDPLCGSDCVTHFNFCQLELKNCLYGTSYTRFLDSRFCPDFTPPEFTVTPPRTLAVTEGKAFTLTCKAAPAGRSPGPQPIISWYLADYEAPTNEDPTLYEPDYGQKLGDGETIKLRMKDDHDIFCVAHQCKHGQSIPIDIVSDSVYVTVAPGEINVWRGGPSCQVFGDPHIITFDNAVYEFEGHCEYILAMDCEKRKWSVYGSFDTCSTHGRGACLSSVTLYYNGEVSLELLRGKIVNNAGKRFDVPVETTPAKITTKSGETLYVFEKDGWVVVKFNFAYDSHYELRWDGLMSAQILLGANAPATCGLCGNANNNTADDFQMRWTGDVVENVNEFGDSWRIDRRNKCKKTAEMPEWEWEKDFADRKQAATTVCNKKFDAPQLVKCATGTGYGKQVSPKPYKEACVSDYMRSDFLPDELAGLNMACVTVMNYAERCGNEANKNHLWREESGCAGETEELEKFKEFIGEFDCDF